MTDEATVCAAAFFRSIGKDVSTPDEFVMGASLDLKWMSPSEAKALLSALIKIGVLAQKGGYVRPAVDVGSVDVPLAYRPSADFLAAIQSGNVASAKPGRKPEAKPDLFQRLMAAAVEAGMERTTFVKESNAVKRTLDIDIGAAALIVMRDHGVDITPYADEVYDELSSA